MTVIDYRLATLDDLPAVLQLQQRYHVDSIAVADKADGFVTTLFNVQQLTALIEQEQGLFLALQQQQVVAYAMAASWQFWSQWPMFAYMSSQLSQLQFQGLALNSHNSYQYGPICVHKHWRGQGVFQDLFAFSLQVMATRYPVLITFINKNNPRSLAAHSQKVGLQVLQEFNYNDNEYYELACLTQSVAPALRR